MSQSQQTPRRGVHFVVTNTTRNTVLANACRKVTGHVSRGIGLMGKKSLPAGGGLIIQPCNSVISFFMRFPIDVVFVDRAGQVCYLKPRMVPWRTSKIVRQSKFVIELPAGTIEATRTELGNAIEIHPVES